jgi:hypothetical protein
MACRRADRSTEHICAGTIQTAARAARIGMKFFITAIGAAQFLNAARHSFLSRAVAQPPAPPLQCFRAMSNTFNLAHPPGKMGDVDVVGVVGINAAGHADFISGRLRNFLVNESLEFSSMASWGCTKPQHKVFLENLNDASPRSPNRPVIAAASRRQC